MFKLTLLGSVAAIALHAAPVAAQTADVSVAAQAEAPAAQTTAAPTSVGDHHSDDDQSIVITGFRPRGDILSGTSVVTGDELARELRPSIGETLARQPGVSATSFGPNASRPVLRGFQGERIRVLTDGIGSLDVSNTSVDHAVAINPLTADRIEVLRGPAALLFGSSAIGGVVNVIGARIPRRMPNEAVHFEGLLSYGSAADERSVNAVLDVPIGGNFVVHLDGNYTKTDDLEVGGFVLSRPLREAAAASDEEEIQELAELRGRIPNTASETSDIAAGAAYIDGETNIGFSVNRYDSLYGVPVRYALDPEAEAEEVRLDIKQTRIDGRADVDLGSGFLDTMRFRIGYADYRHDELEDTGEIGTSFFSDAAEGRLEFVQSDRNGWSGGFGGQFFVRDFFIEGEEKYLPRNETEQYGLFTVQNFNLGNVREEAGLRYERSIVRADADEDIGNPDLKRSFNAFSGSLGASVGAGESLRAGLNLSYTQRAPSAEELYSGGPHAATQAFEIGDPNLSKEKSFGIEGTLRGRGDGYSFAASVFHNWFDNFIYITETGEIEDDLPVFQTFQRDARYFGFELEGSVRVARIGSFAINLDGVADYVRATIVDEGPAPRIPPFRLLGGVEAQSDRLTGRVEVEHVAEQDRVADFETRTDGYTMVNASLAFKPFRNDRGTILLSANNIFDVVGRRHASILKDYAPIAGRDIRVTARLNF